MNFERGKDPKKFLELGIYRRLENMTSEEIRNHLLTFQNTILGTYPDSPPKDILTKNKRQYLSDPYSDRLMEFLQDHHKDITLENTIVNALGFNPFELYHDYFCSIGYPTE